jgi:LCP family protein required for cell wall assembly
MRRLRSIPAGLRLSWRLTAAVFIAGLLAGCVILGWNLWPAPPAQAHMADLRPADREAYLSMLAGVFASNHDVAAARARLAGWPPDEVATDLAASEGQAGADSVESAQLQALAGALGLALPAEGPPTTGTSASAPEEAILPPATRAALATQLALGQGAASDVFGNGAAEGITETTGAMTGTPAAGSTAGLTTQIASDASSGAPVATPTPGPTAVPVDLTQTENILILGTDYRPGDPNWRTDTIMIVVVDQALGRVGIISVPRDLWVNIPTYGQERINVAEYVGDKSGYPGGGAALAQRTILQVLGVPTQHYVIIKQDGLVRLVDTLGGVTVNLDCPLYEMTPDPIVPTAYDRWSLPSGPNLLDGAAAKKFVTYREIQTDFGRERRQQQLLWAIRKRVLQGDVLPRIPDLWVALGDTFTTDLSLPEIVGFGMLGVRLQPQDIHAMSLQNYVTNYTVGGGEVLLLADRAAVQTAMSHLFGQPQLGNVNQAEAVAGKCPPPPSGFKDLSPTTTPPG